MGSIIKLLTGSFGNYILIVVAVVVLGLMATTSWLWGERNDLLVKVGAAEARAVSAEDANQSNVETIKTLKDANSEWELKFIKAESQNKELIASVEDFTRQLDASNVKFRALEDQDRAKPDCKKLLALSVNDVCPAIATGLWQRAHSSKD